MNVIVFPLSLYINPVTGNFNNRGYIYYYRKINLFFTRLYQCKVKGCSLFMSISIGTQTREIQCFDM